MANRMKEDEKNEKIIRGLLKLPANRRCINCNSLGPQYVCTNFWTFICTTCSGIHREFTHRVKSVSLANFTSQEVSALQEGGNERAKEVFLKEWDPQRHYVPDSSNEGRLRDFIKHVYVDKRYTGERGVDRPPRVKMGEKEDSADARRADLPRGGSRSPPYEESYDRRYNDRNYKSGSDERRSPGYDQDYRRSPVRFEVVDDRRFREDRFGNGPQNRKFEDRRFPDEVSSSESRSPNYQKEVEVSSLPVVRPVREILGENVPPLRIGEPPKANGGKSADGLLRAQRTASSSSLGSVESAELKRANSGSLIDFNADPQPRPIATPAQTDLFSSQPVQQQPAVGPTGGDNWASFGFDSQEEAHTTTSNSNSLECQLAQLSSTVAVPTNQKPSSALPAAGGTPESALSQLTAPIAPTTPGGVDAFAKTDGSQWSFTNHSQPSPSPLLVGTSQGIVPQLPLPSGMPNNQPWASSLQPNSQGPSALPHSQLSQAMTTQLPYLNVEVVSKSQQSEVKHAPSEAPSTGRQALPEDLFTASFVPRPVPIQHWQSASSHAFGYGMQYPVAMLQPMPNFTQSSKSANPFDVNSEPTVGHVSSFPPMTPLQTALPRMPVPASLLQTSSFGTPQQWAPPQSSSYLSAVPPGPYMMQQTSNTMVPLGGNERGISGNFGNEGTAFGALSAGQQPGLGYSQQQATHTLPSSGGNPFS